MSLRLILAAWCVLLAVGFAALPPVLAQDTNGHITLENPGKLSEADIHSVYERLLKSMVMGYGASQFDWAEKYAAWTRYNRIPYLSATHGNRYVNNYANATTRGYGALKPGETFAAGTIMAKDSFTVTKKGKVFPGALFVMEKLKPGANPGTADWRYIMVMPDGSLFGDTAGDSADQVAYCHDCHRQKADQDYVFFVPARYR